MTDRHAGYVVTLKRPMREDDAETLVNAIRLLEPVASVTPVVADLDHEVAVERARHQLLMQIADVINPNRKRNL